MVQLSVGNFLPNNQATVKRTFLARENKKGESDGERAEGRPRGTCLANLTF